MAKYDEIRQLQFRFSFDEEELKAFDKVIELLVKIVDEIEKRNCGDIYYKECTLDCTLPIEEIIDTAKVLKNIRILSGEFLDID